MRSPPNKDFWYTIKKVYSMESYYMQATGIGGVGGYFWYTPPGRKIFENTPPPLEILGQAAILFFK